MNRLSEPYHRFQQNLFAASRRIFDQGEPAVELKSEKSEEKPVPPEASQIREIRGSVSETLRQKKETFKDRITRLKKENSELEEELDELQKAHDEETITDDLTGLHSKGYFNEGMADQISSTLRHNQAFSLIMLDIDEFKKLNDTLGHVNGDKALQKVSEIIRNTCRENDNACRYGGEEFAIILPETDSNEAVTVAKRLQAKINAEFRPYLSELDSRAQELKFCSASMGISTYSPDAAERAELQERLEQIEDAEERKGFFQGIAEVITKSADKELYNAKKSGRNTIFLNGKEVQTEEVPKERVERVIDAVIEDPTLDKYVADLREAAKKIPPEQRERALRLAAEQERQNASI